MKTILLTFTLLIGTLIAYAQSEPTTDNSGVSITVNVPVPSDDGTVIIGLYDQKSFMVAPPLHAYDVEIVDGSATATFTNVQPGIYAITLFHDKNGNKQMDFEANGMPIEMYGVSNNVMSAGPPQWSDAKFEVGDEPLTFDIRM